MKAAVSKVGQFLHETHVELTKVTWTTKRDLVKSMVVVLIGTAVLSLFIFAVDTLFTTLLKLIIK
jgi:preprotein translocase subunit SecE